MLNVAFIDDDKTERLLFDARNNARFNVFLYDKYIKTMEFEKAIDVFVIDMNLSTVRAGMNNGIKVFAHLKSRFANARYIITSSSLPKGPMNTGNVVFCNKADLDKALKTVVNTLYDTIRQRNARENSEGGLV
jgi:hypothetical protein